MNYEKKPTELTNEELYTLVEQITKTVVLKKQAINLIMEPEDLAQEVLTYLYDKSARGKTGIEEIKENTMKHFQNILYREVLNTINYQLRKPKVQRFINNTVSLQEPAKISYYAGEKDPTYEDIIEGDNPIEKLEEEYYVESLLNKFSDAIKDDNLSIELNLGDKMCSLTFSYKNIAKTYFNLFKGKKLTFKDFKGIFFNKKTKLALNDNEIRKVLADFRKYIKQNNILGGEVTWKLLENL